MIKKALAVAAATVAMLAIGAGAASAAPNPEPPGQEKEETCVTVFELPLLLVDPPARAEFRVCQEADQGGGGDKPPVPEPPVPAPLG